MTTTTIHNYNPASDPEVRKTGIGGSEAGAVLGLSKWATPLDVYLRKRGLVEEDETGEAGAWGKILEPVVLGHYAEQTGRWVMCRNQNGVAMVIPPHPSDAIYWPSDHEARALGTLRHPSFDHMICHIDGLAYDQDPVSVDEDVRPVAILESKTVGVRMAHEWGEGLDEIPYEYLIQCQHNALIYEAVTGENLPVHVPVLVGGQKYNQYVVVPDMDIRQMLVITEAEFWSRVQAGDPPEPTLDEKGRRAVRKLFPHDTGEEVVVEHGTTTDNFVRMMLDNRAAVKLLKEKQTASEVHVMERMGDTSVLLGDGYKVMWTRSRDRAVVDWEAAFFDLCDLLGLDEATSKSVVGGRTTNKPGSRVFRVYDKRPNEEDE
jgi:predicted phage-related endonuclease